MVVAVATLVVLHCRPVAAQEGVSSSPESPEMVSARRPVVCVIVPLTGPHEGLGKRVRRAIEAVLEGETVTVRAMDSREPEPAAQVARARSIGCDLAIGGIGDRESRTMAEAAAVATMPFLALGAEPDERTRSKVIWVRTSRAETLAAIAQHAIQDEGRDVAHVLVPDSPYGRRVAASFRSEFEVSGGRVVTQRVVPLGEDLAKTAALFAAARAVASGGSDEMGGPRRLGGACEVLFLGFDLISAFRLVPLLEFEGVFLRKVGCPPMMVVGTPLWNNRARVSRLGDTLNGVRFADLELPEGETEVLDAEARDAGLLAKTLLSKWEGRRSEAGVGDKEEDGWADISRWAEGVAFRGATGDLKVRGGRVVGRRLRVFEIHDGTLRPACKDIE